MKKNKTDKQSCGDFGGETASGLPCSIKVNPPGRCHHHPAKGEKPLSGGRPTHAPTNLTRQFVETCAMGGIPQENIGQVLEISEPTLRKHYRPELDAAYIKANAKVLQTAFQMATSGKNTAATIFWLKCRMGWSAKSKGTKNESTGSDGPEIQNSRAESLLEEIDKRLSEVDGFDPETGKVVNIR